MKWLKRKVIQWVRDDWDKEYETGKHAVVSRDSQHIPDDEPILSFRIYSAVNGKVIEFRRWDQKADRNYNSTYIVPKDEGLADYIDKCLNVELLK